MVISRLSRLVFLLMALYLSACASPTDQGVASSDQAPDAGQVDVVPSPEPADVVDTISPTTPGNLRLSGSPDISLVNLVWNQSTDNVAVSGYRIFRNGVHISSTLSNAFSDITVQENTSYQYQVEAFDAENNTARSNVLNVTTSIATDIQQPTVPGNLLLTDVTADHVSMSWTRSTDNVAVSGYRIFRDGALLNSTTSNSFSDSTVNDNTSYQYQVEAFDAENNTARSNVLNVSTPAADDVNAPVTPGNLNLTNVTTNQISFSWTASTDNVGVVGYRIYRNYSNTSYATTATLSFTDSGLSPAQTYAYSVSAIDAAGNESFQSAVMSVDTLAVVVTQPVELSWLTPTQNTDDSCLDAIQSYKLSYGVSSGNYSSTVNLDLGAGQVSCVQSGFDNVCSAPIMTCSYTIDSLEAGTWYFALQAVDSVGVQSGLSNEASKLVN